MMFEEFFQDKKVSVKLTEIPVYKCTQKDLDKFYPMSERTKNLFDFFQYAPGGGYYCVDFDKYNFEIKDTQYGSFNSKNLYLVMEPC